MAKEKKKEPRERTAANPLPYLITFVILFIIACILLTWVLDVFNKETECGANPNIWCSDSFLCEKQCTIGSDNQCRADAITKDAGGQAVVTNNAGLVDPCYCQNINNNGNVEGIAGCLFGPTGFNAQYCNSDPSAGGASCDCPLSSSTTQNCFSTCPTNRSELPKTNCCANGSSGCPLAPGNTG
jgi:hypothetical protein